MTDSNDRFANLPDPIQKAIDDSGWQAKLRAIASKYHLRIDQSTVLENETLAIMDGSQSIEEYTLHLAAMLKLNEADLRAMAADLERDIFFPLQKAIQGLVIEDNGTSVGTTAVGADEEDDLEALLNEGDSALAHAATLKPIATPVAPAAKPIAAPIVPPINAKPTLAAPVSVPAPIAAPAVPAVAAPLSAAAQKLAAPVVKPAETVVGNLQKAPPAALAAPAAVPPAGHDPYREPVI